MLFLGALRLCLPTSASALHLSDPYLIPILQVRKLIREVSVNKPSVSKSAACPQLTDQDCSVGEPGHEIQVAEFDVVPVLA